MRVRRSAMGSVMLMPRAPYQLALETPGSSPRATASRTFTRASPKRRYTPRERPVMAQRLRPRLGLASRGSFCSFTCASARASGEVLGLRMSSLRAARFAAYFFTIFARRFSRSTMFVLAIPYGSLLAERETEGFKQGLARLVVLRRRGERDVHAPELVDLVVLDFRENDLFLDAQAVVATAIEGTRVDAAEVANTRDRDRDQTIEELPHTLAAQRHLRSDGEVLAHLERSDRLLRQAEDGLLARDLREVVDRRVHDLAVRHGLAHAHIHRDLGDLGDLHDVLQTQVLLELRNDCLLVELF